MSDNKSASSSRESGRTRIESQAYQASRRALAQIGAGPVESSLSKSANPRTTPLATPISHPISEEYLEKYKKEMEGIVDTEEEEIPVWRY